MLPSYDTPAYWRMCYRMALAQRDLARRERDAAREQLAAVVTQARSASATDGGWLAALLQRSGRG